MNNTKNLVHAIVQLNDGKMVGKTRLQKTVYILGVLGLESSFEFQYAHYGPFCAELARATEDAIAMGLLEPDQRPGFHAVPYTVFESKKKADLDSLMGLSQEKIESTLEVLGTFSAVELELAATILYLEEEDGLERKVSKGAVTELKPLKATEKRLGRAENLLEQLGF